VGPVLSVLAPPHPAEGGGGCRWGRAVGGGGPAREVAPLVRALQHGNAMVREAALVALKEYRFFMRVATDDEVPPLCCLTQSSPPNWHSFEWTSFFNAVGMLFSPFQVYFDQRRCLGDQRQCPAKPVAPPPARINPRQSPVNQFPPPPALNQTLSQSDRTIRTTWRTHPAIGPRV